MGNGKVRGVGVAMAMQGSSIAGVDVGGADIKLNEDGSYTLALGCTDMGTGCDTIMAQIAATVLRHRWKILLYSVWILIFHHMIPVLCFFNHIYHRCGSYESLPGASKKDL